MTADTPAMIRILLFLLVASAADTAMAAVPVAEPDICARLYAQASALEPRSRRYQHVIFNDQTRRLVAVIGTVAEPALYYYGIAIPWDYYQNIKTRRARHALDQVRAAMASQRCFLK